jgi:hypothetical protein
MNHDCIFIKTNQTKPNLQMSAFINQLEMQDIIYENFTEKYDWVDKRLEELYYAYTRQEERDPFWEEPVLKLSLRMPEMPDYEETYHEEAYDADDHVNVITPTDSDAENTSIEIRETEEPTTNVLTHYNTLSSSWVKKMFSYFL